ARALGERLRAAGRVAHGVEDPALDRLQAVGDLGQRARLDRRYRVAEVGLRGVGLDRRRVFAVVGSEEIWRPVIHCSASSLKKVRLRVRVEHGQLDRGLGFAELVGVAGPAARFQWYLPPLSASRVTFPSLVLPSQ